MTEPAIALIPPTKAAVKKVIDRQPPRLNERVFIGSYASPFTLEEHAGVIRRCGLTAEIEAVEGMKTCLYAARRRGRNKHD